MHKTRMLAKMGVAAGQKPTGAFMARLGEEPQNAPSVMGYLEGGCRHLETQHGHLLRHG